MRMMLGLCVCQAACARDLVYAGCVIDMHVYVCLHVYVYCVYICMYYSIMICIDVYDICIYIYIYIIPIHAYMFIQRYTGIYMNNCVDVYRPCENN